MAEENAVQEIEPIDENVLEDIFPDRYPLSNLGEEEPATPAEKEAVKVEDEPVTTTGTDGEQEQISGHEAKSDRDKGLEAALLAERRKRQLLEDQLRQQAQVEEKKEFNWDNPEESLKNIEANFDRKLQKSLLNMSEAQCQARHEDYSEKYAVFQQMAMDNPAIINEMLTKPDPAEYAYQLAKHKMFTDEVGADPKTYEDKLKAKIRSELEAEYQQKLSNRQALVDSLPPSAKGMTNKITPPDVVTDAMDELFPGEHPS